jgi:hypothetical protein
MKCWSVLRQLDGELPEIKQPLYTYDGNGCCYGLLSRDCKGTTVIQVWQIFKLGC